MVAGSTHIRRREPSMKLFVGVLITMGCLGAATAAYAAEVPPPSVSVEGVASVPISQTANQSEADAVYRQGLTAAIADGHGKAEFLATQTGATLGSIQQIVERGGSIECTPSEVGPQTEYEPYKGAQPDFGSVELSGSRFVAAPEAARSTVSTRKVKPKRKKHKAKKAADTASCTLSTQVVLSYLLT
jgi:hypothetical protein